jgi:hypothetical protein
MSIDDILIAIIMAGIGFSGAYLGAELALHRRTTAAQRKMEAVQLELYTDRTRFGLNDMSRQPLQIQRNVFRRIGAVEHASGIVRQGNKFHQLRIRT